MYGREKIILYSKIIGSYIFIGIFFEHVSNGEGQFLYNRTKIMVKQISRGKSNGSHKIKSKKFLRKEGHIQYFKINYTR